MTAPTPKRLENRRNRQIRKTIVARAERHEACAEKRRERRTPKRRVPVPLPAELERQLQGRAAGRCELCAEALAGRCHRHHRKLRSQGGRDDVTNLVVLHFNCHNTIHNNRVWSEENGWIVPSHKTPARIPINLHGQRVVRLTNTGGYQAAA